MGEYKKVCREDVDFPNYCYFFISEMIDSLQEYDITNEGDELSLEIETHDHPYCYDAFELIVRTFKRKGYNTNVPTFKLEYKDDIKTYTYKWKIVKGKEKSECNVDDLPF